MGLELPCCPLTLPRLEAQGILISFPYGFSQTTYDAGFLQHRRGRTVHERRFLRVPQYFLGVQTLSLRY